MIGSRINLALYSDLLFVLLIFLIVIINGCGDGSNNTSTLQSTEITSIPLKIFWHNGSDKQNLGEDELAAALDCAANGVDHVVCQVYDTFGTLLATGGPWSCSVGTGRIDVMASGSDRTFVVLAEDINNNIGYHGQTSGITIEVNKVTEGVIVDAYPFIPSLQLPTDGVRVIVNSFELNWEALQNAYEYRLLISENPDLTDPVVNAVTSTPPYEPIDLIPVRQYYWAVRALDQYGNEGHMDDVRRFETVSSDYEDTVPPEIPTGLTGVAVSASRIDISWNDASDDFAVNGYRIYRGDAQFQTAATSYSDIALNPSTRYCYRIEAFDMAGNASGQSDSTCVTTLDSWVLYRDQDGDGFGDPARSIETQDPTAGYVADNTDCNDQEETIHPGAPEECDDGIDQDCNGSDQACPPGPEDLDGDGYIEDDCNNNNSNIHPGANEVCDGVDNDCDRAVDEGLSRPTTCGIGACAGNTGTASCINGEWSNSCDPYAGATEEVCSDEVDNDCDGGTDENDCVIDVNYYTLTVTKDGDGTGTVTSSPSGVSCGTGCTEGSHDYEDGTRVTLTADPTGYSFFDGWSGGGCSGIDHCTVTMNQARTVTARFSIPEPVCEGVEFGGYCWHHGAQNASCNEVCGSHGGYHEATRYFTGSDGSNQNCINVLGALGIYEGTFYETTQGGIGCFTINGAPYRYRDTQTTTASATYGTPGRRRVCACQN
mgnify:CR=1 FL=1